MELETLQYQALQVILLHTEYSEASLADPQIAPGRIVFKMKDKI